MTTRSATFALVVGASANLDTPSLSTSGIATEGGAYIQTNELSMLDSDIIRAEGD